ncbi:MAG: AAA family ATPase [Rhodospirillaceae bacterium]|jgi:chromosome partitioning protein|nr:AAA family ATPase [Rhodospirillaceae bacterium]MBT5243338.1 AAA family ATPase [Rhodospirillaceae bacterium]MBT5561804.1 AAA family ATPase [Rhodospirillaceae bacterium]MBT6240918.1 AAA family ATPase [Rhodospirillaceae bacterium]MBT7137385.1 AAA family ATPase [Rhodospirillaceae bacterium]
MTSKRAHVIVTGNEKGGSGKSTTAMHLVIGLLRDERRVAAIDLDARQGTLTNYLGNRQRFIDDKGMALPMPEFRVIEHSADLNRDTAEIDDEKALDEAIGDLSQNHDVIVIDTPGADSILTRLGHSFADTLITPLNDSFIDLDVLARVDPVSLKIQNPSHYSEMVWQQKMRRAQRDGGSTDWIVMRNRLSHVDARNKREVERLLGELAARVGFRQVAGFGERVIYRELFLAGLTMMDIIDVLGPDSLTMSHLSARQEVRGLIDAIGLP